MPVLTLARFILEFSLMEYLTIKIPDSKLAAAALYLALQMKHIGGWNSTLEFYSGKLCIFLQLFFELDDKQRLYRIQARRISVDSSFA